MNRLKMWFSNLGKKTKIVLSALVIFLICVLASTFVY